MHHFAVSWWNSNGQQSPQTSSKKNNSKGESPKQQYHVSKPLDLQLSDDSSSSQSFGAARLEISVQSGDNESPAKDVESQMKPGFLVHFPYPNADTYFGGLFPTYGPQALIQGPMNSQMVGISPARVPLPAEIAQDEPIYVNAKQYHGILRRRQLRAKLEAQNKLIKNRKPYLHESRHLHALNRVRGSGGRFLSTKKVHTDSVPATSTQRARDSIQLHLDNDNMLSSGHYHSGPPECVTPHSPGLDFHNISTSKAIFQQSDARFSSIASLQCNGSQICSGNHHNASAVK